MRPRPPHTPNLAPPIALALSLVTSLGCLIGEEEPAPLSPAEQAAQRQADHIAEYEALAAALERDRQPLLPPTADALRAHGDTIYWLEHRSVSPTLHRMTPDTGDRIDYAFDLGAGEMANWRGSEQLVASAQPEGSTVVYRAWRADSPDHLLGELALEAPRGEARWWAYAVDHDVIYIVRDEPGHAEILRWDPSTDTVDSPGTLQQAGIDLGRFEDFAVFDEQMILVESGRLWEVDLRTCEARWLRNAQQVRRASFDRRGVLYGQGDMSLTHIDLGSRTIRRVTEEINALNWLLNSTYAQLHHHAGGEAVLDGRTVYYMSAGGALMGYDLERRRLCPVLLSPRVEPDSGDPHVTYSSPVLLGDGTLLVTGLESTSGAVGVDGPVYRVTPRCR